MKSIAGEDFFHSAVHYCSIIENFDSNQVHKNLNILLVALVDLYSKALCLPEVEPENDEVTDFDISSLPHINFNQYDLYWEVFNPYTLEEPVVGSLSDDILDIYKDLKNGIHLFERNELKAAIWIWKFGFEIHWGSHAVDAIRALHSAKFI